MTEKGGQQMAEHGLSLPGEYADALADAGKHVEYVVVHELKCWPEHFQAIKRGDKTLEIRRNDRDFKVDHVLHLHEWDPVIEGYTGDELYRVVTHVLPGGQFGLAEGFAALSIAAMTLPDEPAQHYDGDLLADVIADACPRILTDATAREIAEKALLILSGTPGVVVTRGPDDEPWPKTPEPRTPMRPVCQDDQVPAVGEPEWASVPPGSVSWSAPAFRWGDG